MKTLAALLSWGIDQLSESETGSATPELDVQLLLCSAAGGLSKVDLLLYPDKIIEDRNIALFKSFILARKQGTPVALIMGHQGFWNLDLKVTLDTLIPRPETELLIEIVLEKGLGENQKILDLGTGTGAIGLAIAKERPHWHVVATDVYAPTLKVAEQNKVLNHIHNIVFKQGSWFAALQSTQNPQFNIIVSNPPYIAQADPHLSHPTLQFEPKRALVSGEMGLNALTEIIEQAPDFLQPGGLLVLEHGYDQKEAVQQLLAQRGFQDIETRTDLAGMDRATFGVWR